MPPHSFLITGGAGFVGRALAAFLRVRGAYVRTLDLEPAELESGLDPELHIQGDLRNADILKRAIEGVDVVVHAGAALPLWSKEDIFSINVDGTSAVLRACATLGIGRMVHLSTTAVYGCADHEGIREDEPLRGSDPYARSKILSESLIETYRTRLCVPVLRAKLVVGPGRLGIFDVIFDWVRRGKHIPLIGRGDNPYQMLHVEDLAAAIWSAASAPEGSANDTFNIAAAEYGTVRADFQALLDHAGFGRRVIGLPAAPVKAVLRTLDFLRLSPLSPSITSAADKASSVSVEKARRSIGWAPQRSNVRTLVDAFDWYVAHHQGFRGRTGITHRHGLKQGVLSIVRAFF